MIMIPILASVLIAADPVASLGSRHHAEREAAQRICEGGTVPMADLDRGLGSDDPEVRWRCSKAILKVYGHDVQGRCPACDGQGQRYLLVPFGWPGESGWVQCSTCEGTGIVKGRALAAWGATK